MKHHSSIIIPSPQEMETPPEVRLLEIRLEELTREYEKLRNQGAALETQFTEMKKKWEKLDEQLVLVTLEMGVQM